MPESVLSKALEELVNSFSLEKLKDEVLYFKFKDLSPDIYERRLYEFEDEKFSEINEILKVTLKDSNVLKAYAIRVEGELSERSSKKRQFELAKRILRTIDNVGTQAGLFTFYDENGNFRFSLVYKVYQPGKTTFSHFKRYTYYIEKRRPYRTFLKAFLFYDYTTLSSIKSAFSIIPLTKEFFEEIQNWYAWALKYSWFPGGILEENLIRLLTRLIFVWFLKEKKLIPEEIFEKEYLKGIVKDFGKGNFYYNVILQNLFFATLNRYPEDRRFAKEGSFLENKTEFGVKTLFRYRDKLLVKEDEFLTLFSQVPFVNGGLFECLDEDKNYVDGFSRNESKRAKLPDVLFFSEEREEELSEFYGEKRKVKVRGLINILKDYNFTADESSPVDVEVSLDPELLGHIFENLLASYNPETQTTARKVTGSYYTPKEIVDFMVEEALIEYFKTKTSLSEEEIRKILSYSDEELELGEKKTKELITAIDSLKIIDPAVGSGAFPMGIVHKLVHILSKIDPQNKLWYELQFEKAIHEIEQVLKLEDKGEREKLLKEVNENFDESINYPDYARKLYIIENSIYGVDIQPIATQICKLRFFLSLLIDQKVDKEKSNFGIKPLPHLETKFVCANTLIALEKPKQLSLGDNNIRELKEELRNVYKRFFRIKTRAEKLRLKEKAERIKQELKNILQKLGFPSDTTEKIVNFDIFSQTAKADWFDLEWMFGIEDGFDIVIGNPPYVRQEKIKNLKPVLKAQGYKTFEGTADLYVYFYEKGYELLKEGGVLSFISSNKWLRTIYGQKLRKFLKENTTLLKLVDFNGYKVFAQTVDTCIMEFLKKKPSPNHEFSYAIVPSDTEDPIEYIKNNQKNMKQEKLSDNAWTLGDEKVLALKEKIEKVGKPLKDWDVKIYRGVLTGFDKAFIIDTETRNKILANCKTEEERKRTEAIIKPVLRGRDIERWRYEWAGLWVICTFPSLKLNIDDYPALRDYLASFGERLLQDGKPGHRKKTPHKWFETQDNIAYYPEFEKEKIVWNRITEKIIFSYVNAGYYILDSTFMITGKNLKFLIAILNSNTISWWIKLSAATLGDGSYGAKIYIEKSPIPPITPQNQHIVKQIEELASQILSLTQSDDYEENLQKQAQVKNLEKQIDSLVYKLYGLTEEEIKIIEGGG